MNHKILAYPHLEIDEDGVSFSSKKAAQRLRFLILYFDEIQIVPFNIGTLGCYAQIEDEDVAIQQGLISCVPQRRLHTGQTNLTMLNEDYTEVFKNSNKDNGSFAIATPPGQQFGNPSTQINCIFLHIYNRLPSPGADVPLDEIRKFKKLHEADLAKFHRSLNEICLLFSEKGVVGHETIVSKLDENLASLENALENACMGPILSSLTVGRLLLASTPILAEAGMQTIGVPAGVGLVSAIATNWLSASLGHSLFADPEMSPPDMFQYTFHGVKSGIFNRIDYDHPEYEWKNNQFIGNVVNVVRHVEGERVNELSYCKFTNNIC